MWKSLYTLVYSIAEHSRAHNAINLHLLSNREIEKWIHFMRFHDRTHFHFHFHFHHLHIELFWFLKNICSNFFLVHNTDQRTMCLGSGIGLLNLECLHCVALSWLFGCAKHLFEISLFGFCIPINLINDSEHVFQHSFQFLNVILQKGDFHILFWQHSGLRIFFK